jgi:ferrous iron transport protein B
MKTFQVAIAGNPNCGKTALFNALTGARQQVGNWPGVTVERVTGTYTYKNHLFEVTDLPGIYSFSAYSLDEVVSRSHILQNKPDLVINILDANNLQRNLYLTTQLLEMRAPMIAVLNMMDLAAQNGVKIEIDHLARHLGCPVIPIVATKKTGIEELRALILDAAEKAEPSETQVEYDSELEKVIEAVSNDIRIKADARGVPSRWAALKLLEKDEWATEFLGADEEALSNSANLIQRAEKHIGEEIDIVVADGRYGFIHGLARDVVQQKESLRSNITEKIDNIVLNRILGIPFFFFIMYLVFAITMNVGGPFIDFFDQLFGAIFVDGFSHLLTSLHAPDWAIALLADGLGGGLQTVSTFIPPIFFIFLCLSFLEDSGYMSRAAFVMDRFLRTIGLPGKAFIPMLVGFGCNVPGIMATRTLENRRDRILAMIINPFMSCGARLPVYTLFAAAFFPNSGGLIIFGLYMTGIVLAVISGLLFKRTILQGEVSTFVMELPHYHLPTLNGILFHTWTRLKDFIIRAGQIILLVVVILGFLNSIGTDGSIGNTDSEKSALSAMSKTITPLFRPMGITDDNWPATVGLFTGIFAKEAVVGTLDSLYASLDSNTSEENEQEESFNLLPAIQEAFATIPAGFSGLWSSLIDPLGFSGAMTEIATEGEETSHTAMINRFGGAPAAIAYLLFILIYCPCVAVIAAIGREAGIGWAAFSVAYLTLLAWTVATGFYQLFTFAAHPLSSSLWLGTCLAIAVGGYQALRLCGSRSER